MRYRLLFKICLIIGLVSSLAVSFADSADDLPPPTIEWRLSQYWPHASHASLWTELSDHFELNHDLNQPTVRDEIHFLKHHQDYINELTTNARPYLYYVYSQTLAHNMPAEIALVPMIESDYDPFGISSRGATGLWQMMPGTASGLGLKINWWYDGRRNIIKSTSAALKHLQYLHSYFGNWLLALAAYDAGDGTVRAAIRYNKRHHRPTDFWHLPLPLETRLYVPKLLGIAAVIAKHNHYGLYLNNIPNHPFFDGIRMTGQIAMTRVAKMAHTSLTVVRELNPAFRRWATAPTGSYWLLLPADKANLFQKALYNSEKSQNVTWMHHHVTQGDSLSVLAAKYHTKVSVLKTVNHLNGNVIHVGQELLIPESFNGKLPAMKKQISRIAEDKIPGPKRFEHIVKKNENLWIIAARYNLKPSQIRYWNNLSYHEKIKPNEKLIIWKKQKVAHSSYYVYTVKSGDNLSRIGSRYHTSARVIMHLNNLTSSVIHKGEKLRIPYNDQA